MVSTCDVLVVLITQHYSGFSDLLLAKFSDSPLNVKQKVREGIRLFSVKYIVTLLDNYSYCSWRSEQKQQSSSGIFAEQCDLS